MDPRLGLIDLDALVASASHLEPPAPVALRLASLMRCDDWELDAVADIASHDAALAGRLLRVSNSAAMASVDPITTVSGAVLRLGGHHVASIAIAIGARRHLQQDLPRYAEAEGTLWRHSVAATIAVEEMPRALGLEPPPECHSAALLHDIGRVVLARHLDAAAHDFLERAHAEGGLASVRAEIELLGVDHAELGALIVQSWGLPQSLIEPIRLHHDPMQASEPYRAACEAVAIADAVARRLVPGFGEEPPDLEAEPELRALIGEPSRFDALCDGVAGRLEKVLAAYAG